MNALARARRAARHLALGPLGIKHDFQRIFAAQAGVALHESDALRLPVDTSEDSPLLVGISGARSFIIGMDPLGGENPIT